MSVFSRTFRSLSWKNLLPLVLANTLLLVGGPTSWNFYDVRYFIYGWYKAFTEGNLIRVYSYYTKVSYPPVPVLVFVFFHALATSFSSENLLIIRLIDKIPLILSFNAIYFLLRKRFGSKAGNLWLLNPMGYMVIFGYQFDIITAMFLLMGYILLIDRRYFLSGVAFSLATLTKQLVGLIPFLSLLYLYKRKEYVAIKAFIAGLISTIVLIVTPFFIASPQDFVNKVFLFHGTRLPQYLSLWAIPIYIMNYDYASIPEAYFSLWIPVFLTFIAYMSYKILRKENALDEDTLLRYIILLLIGSLLLNKIGNNNYYLWVIPFLAILYGRNREVVKPTELATYIYVAIHAGFLYGFFTIFSSAVAGRPIFIFEDQSWVSAEQLLANSMGIDSPWFMILLQLRSSQGWLTFFEIVDTASPLIHTFFAITYSLSLLYLYWQISEQRSR